MANDFRRDLLLVDTADQNRVIADGSLSYQIFNSSTWLTDPAENATTLTVDSTEMLSPGDHVYIEGNDGLIEVTTIPSETTFTTPSGVTAEDNAAVVVAKKGGVFDYASIYAQPNEETLLTNPLAPGDGNAVGYIRPGQYGARLTNSALSVTHELRTMIHLGGQPVYTVHPDASSPTSGIMEAILALPTAGGTIVLGSYTYLMRTVDAVITIPSNVRILGQGAYATLIQRDTNIVGATAAHMLRPENGASNIELRDFAIDGSTPTNTWASQYSNIFSGWLDNCLFQRLRLINSAAAGININGGGGSGELSNNIHVENCFVENCQGGGIAIRAGRDIWVINNTVKTTGMNGIGLSEHLADPSEFNNRRNWILGNYVDRSTFPTGMESGDAAGQIIAAGQGGTEVFIINNLAWDNRVTLVNDGISAGSDASQVDFTPSARTIIADNVVGFSRGFGIDTGPLCTCTGNIVYKPGTHGIAIYTVGTEAITQEPSIIANNMVIDPVNPAGFNTLIGILAIVDGDTVGMSVLINNNYIRDNDGMLRTGIGITVANDPGDTAVMDRVRIQDNTVQHATASRDFSAIRIECSNSGTIQLVDIRNNDLGDIASTGTLRSIEWAGDNLEGIVRVAGLGTNIMVVGDTYSGTTVLSSGVSPAICAGLPSAVWNTMHLRYYRQSTASREGGAVLGHLNAIWDTTNGQFTIEALDTDAVARTAADTSTIYYELVGGSAA